MVELTRKALDEGIKPEKLPYEALTPGMDIVGVDEGRNQRGSGRSGTETYQTAREVYLKEGKIM